MTTNHHTAISTGAAANAATINTPLGELDAVIPKNGSGEGVSVDTDGTITLKLGDTGGTEKVSVTDSGDAEVVSIDSNGEVKAPSFSSGSNTLLNDDTAMSFTAPQVTVLVIFYCTSTLGTTREDVLGIVLFDTSTPDTHLLVQSGSLIELTTGALAGTTGTDTKFNVSAHTDGKVYFENRIGQATLVSYMVLGG